MQFEHCFATVPDDMHVGGTMIVWINDHPQSSEAQDGRHDYNLTS